MPVRITLEQVLAGRRQTAKDLAREIGLSETQLSLFRSGKVKGIRFETLARLCAALGCRPGDLLDYQFDEADLKAAPDAAGEL
jgi:putative transcriptional regulator